MTKRWEIFRVLGFPIRVDASWFIILVLVTYSLAAGFFPAQHPGMPTSAYWAMGFVAAVGLFLSILFHELSHALVARHFKLSIGGITLFIFGGVAEMETEPPQPKVEFWMAVVGPVASLVLAAGFFYLSRFLDAAQFNRPLTLIFYYLAFINAILAFFNLVPAFPLDGGRVFRSILWAIKKDYLWATRISARLGQVFGWLLVAWGVWTFLRGVGLGGVWYVLIGLFLQRASKASFEQAKIQGPLSQMSVRELMDPHPVTLHRDESLFEVLSKLGRAPMHTHYPVLQGDRLTGVLPMQELKALSDPNWEHHRVEDYYQKDVEKLSLMDQGNAWEAFQKMRMQGASLLFLVDELGQFKGWVTMERILRALQNFLKPLKPSLGSSGD